MQGELIAVTVSPYGPHVPGTLPSLSEYERCPSCGGWTQPEQNACRECGGDGEHECSCGDEHECRHCGGSGVRGELRHKVCVRCDGTGNVAGRCFTMYPHQIIGCGGLGFVAAGPGRLEVCPRCRGGVAA